MKNKTDNKFEYEFGGPFGALCVILFSHFLVYYLWISLTYFQGSILLPHSFDDIGHFFWRLWSYVQYGAYPTIYATYIYLGFFAFQFFLAWTLPGVKVKGLAVPSENNIQYDYLCNGLASWYVTLAVAMLLHFTGIFPLTALADNMGALITIAIIFANIASLGVYITSAALKKQADISGNAIYDFFMGRILNPRIGPIDLKLFSDIRIPWMFLFFLTISAAAKQYKMYGYVSWPMIFMIIAHGLYTNACMKGEECVPSTWDIFHEKYGWMLIFWNFVGVPFVYCFQSYYILVNDPEYPFGYTLFLFLILFSAYYVWDTANSQKNCFRMQSRGTYVKRNTFPQLPWGKLKNPKYIKTKNGSLLLIDGWYKYGRKIHYTADFVMGLTWALNCGFSGILPYVYPAFFLAMITHRYQRDSQRCAKKYEKDWVSYCKAVPYKFIPYLY